MLKTLIIDDERLARLKLNKMLREFGNIDIVGEAESVDEAILKIQNLNPELLLLDIQMPGKSGFDLLNEIDYDGRVIFVTAFDEYAIKAFEVNALDYLLKPVTHERLEKALNRFETETPPAFAPDKKLNPDDLLFLLVGQSMRFIKIRSIVFISSAIDYTNVYTNDGHEGLVLKSLREWEERLPVNIFCRIHRSTIINTEYVHDVEKWFNQSYQVYLKGIEEPFIMSKRYAKKLKEKLG
nr:response regulator transcription factor [Bacteroidota bacterium]